MKQGASRQRNKAARPAARRASARKTGAKSDAASQIDSRRDRIIAVAAQRIARHGFEATTVRQIADDVNILSGSLYHHFATKDEILYEVVKDAATLLRDETLRIAALDAAPETKLVALVMVELGEMVRNHAVHAILYNERKILRGREEFAAIRQAKQDAYRAWRGIVEAGIACGEFDPALDIYQTIRTITRMLNMAAEWYAGGDETISTVVEQYSYDEVEAFHLRFILGAVRHPDRAHAPVALDEARRIVVATPSEPTT